MMLSNIFRFPGLSCPTEALTGDTILDDYIKRLDKQLWGSAKIRIFTLAEVKNHLVEAKTGLMQSGITEHEASIKAVGSMGSIESYSNVQRKSLKVKLLKIGLQSGILFGVFMGLYQWIIEAHNNKVFINPLTDGIVYGLFEGAFFGFFMGWFATLVWPERNLPSHNIPDNKFCVEYSKPMRFLSKLVIVVFCLMAVWCIAVSISEYPSRVPVKVMPAEDKQLSSYLYQPWWLFIGLGLLSGLNIFLVRSGCRSFQINQDGFWINQWFARKQRILWPAIKSIGTLGETYGWIPSWNYWRKVKYINYVLSNGKTRRIYLYPDMLNADKFILLLQAKVGMKD
ncbi:hypothetical protein HY772_01380 [Candidatus Woesearchaeota archaeon]|nr:hypothetical protein [Candidatus Woesearchaeota archaeon]